MLVFITIFFATVIAVGLFSILGFSFYLKRKTNLIKSENQKQFADPPVYRSLFEPSDTEMRALEIEQKAKQTEEQKRAIFACAEAGDFNALVEARNFEIGFYDKVLSKLVETAETDENFASLCAFLEANDLRTNAETVRKLETVWRKSPDKKDTIKLLHLAAKTESAEFFSETLENVIQHWRNGFLPQLTYENLLHLAESEFWLLPPDAKTSGAGFLLKQKLASLRAEAGKSDSLNIEH